MKELTLLFLHREDEVLLALKKRGFGEGRWNGVGGKIEPGETPEQAAVRETEEEIFVTPTQYKKVGELAFDAYVNGKKADMLVHTYLCDQWEGEPTESEEMRPKWTAISDVPYDHMWQDDKYWLPMVLEQGKKVTGTFVFDEQDVLLSHTIQEVEDFGPPVVLA